MKGSVEKFSLAGRDCACFVPEKGEGPLPLAVLCGWELDSLLPSLAESLPPMLLFWAPADGGCDFTPWPVPPVWEGEVFTGGAAGYLSFLTDTALPFLEREYGASPDPAHRAVLGYSLGGLFSLWALCRQAPFSLFGSLSGSLWYEGFLDCLRAAPLRGDERVYLSLGDREEWGGPPRIRAVGDCTRQAAEYLSSRLPDAVFQWNRGGHGKGVGNRWKKALAWTAQRIGK